MAKRVAIIGAGPVGLAAASHSLERGLTPLVLEQGPEAGFAVKQWGHVRMFSPWSFNIDKASAKLLARADWSEPDRESYPTGGEFVEHYLTPLATQTALAGMIVTDAKVTAVTRKGFDKVKTNGREQAPFEIVFAHKGGIETVEAETVIDASGTWFSPNPAGANGVAVPGEAYHAEQIAYGMPDVSGRDRERYNGKAIAVLGSGHSALGTLIDLAQLGTDTSDLKIFWLTRKTEIANAFGGGKNDQLEARGELGLAFESLVQSGGITVVPDFRLRAIATVGRKLQLHSEAATARRTIIADQLIVATGFRPDLTFLRELRVELDPALECPPALAPLIDPNLHSCGTVRPHGARELSHPESGFYIAGMKSYGRAPTFLAMTGYEQVRSIIAEIAGDHVAASRVELVLPETGVCNAPGVEQSDNACCGGPATIDAAACCVEDALAKAKGTTGCGCSEKKSKTHPRMVACCG